MSDPPSRDDTGRRPGATKRKARRLFAVVFLIAGGLLVYLELRGPDTGGTNWSWAVLGGLIMVLALFELFSGSDSAGGAD